MTSRKKILIFFEGPHLAYSPSTIQLYDELSKNYDVTLLAQNPDNYNGKRISGRNVEYYRYYGVKTRHFYQAAFLFLSLFNGNAKTFKKLSLGYRDYFFRFMHFKKLLREKKIDRIVCVDISNMFFCSLLDKKADFMSLEVCKDHHLINYIKKENINCVIIQSRQRYEYLFGKQEIRTFYVQNAPAYKEITARTPQHSLIYSGAAHDSFGFYHCLDYLVKYPDEKMVLQGALLPEDNERVQKKYGRLLSEKRLILHLDYLENDDVVDFIANYEIGFCFYNFEHYYVKQNAFNYMSAPSGKMFKYLAAGVPVVASNIPGFSFVSDYECGILIDSLDEHSIRQSVEKIRQNLHQYSKNARTAAKDFSFDKAIRPYLEFISSSLNP